MAGAPWPRTRSSTSGWSETTTARLSSSTPKATSYTYFRWGCCYEPNLPNINRTNMWMVKNEVKTPFKTHIFPKKLGLPPWEPVRSRRLCGAGSGGTRPTWPWRAAQWWKTAEASRRRCRHDTGRHTGYLYIYIYWYIYIYMVNGEFGAVLGRTTRLKKKLELLQCKLPQKVWLKKKMFFVLRPHQSPLLYSSITSEIPIEIACFFSTMLDRWTVHPGPTKSPLQRVGLGELFPKLLEEFHNLRETLRQQRANFLS